MPRERLRVFIAALALLVCSASLALELTPEEQAFIRDYPVIIVGGEMDWPPMDFVEDGVYQGAAKDYLDEIAAISGLQFNVRTGDTWSELLAKLDRREIDMVPMMYWTDRRGTTYNMTNPYITVRHYAFTKGERKNITGLNALSGKTVAVPAGYAYIEFLNKEHPDINVLEVPTVLDAVDAVVTGNADVVIENTASIGYYAAKHGIVGLTPAFPIKFEVNNVHMAVRRDWPILRSILQKSLNAIPKSTTSEIMARWTGSEATAQTFMTAEVDFTPQEQNFLLRQSSLAACVQSAYMPFESMEAGRHNGMMSDYLNIVGGTLRTPISVIPVADWAAAKTNLLSGKCNLATLHVQTEHDGKGLQTTKAVVSENLALVTSLETPFLNSVDELSDVSIVVIEGFSDIESLRWNHPTLQFSEVASREKAYQMVKDGEVFGLLDFVLTASQEIARDHQEHLKVSAVSVTDRVDIGFVIRSDEPPLVSAISKVIEAIPDAQHRSIRDKWIVLKVEEKMDYQLAMQVLIGAVLVLAGVLFRLYYMRRHEAEIEAKNTELEAINRKLEEQRQDALYRAHHDQLTGLSNRTKLQLDLEQATKLSMRTRSKIGLMFLDLDRFKIVNDSLGHDIGDDLLIAVASRLTGLLRETDYLARIGGDEFIAVLQGINDDYSPSIVSQRIIEALSTPFEIGDHTVSVGTSIGISIFPDDSSDITTLIKYADGAMYAAKESGRNTARYHVNELSQKAERRLKIEQGIRHALQHHKFQLAFQPIIDLQTGKASKAEAFIRWMDPDFADISVDELIRVAEESRSIIPISEWVLDSACEATALLTQKRCSVDTIAINVASMEFKIGDVTDRFQAAIQRHGIRADQIAIEITEGHMFDINEQVEADIRRLRDLGHNLIVDDFGTGYSSLSNLKRLPLNIIKIDRMFIQNISNDQSDIEITLAIISLSHSLGYQVLAEGVETFEQVTFLRQHGCDFAQGYYFAKPMFIEEFIEVSDAINAENPSLAAASSTR